MFKKLGLSMVAALIMVTGALGASADDTETPPPNFTDGRVNAYDAAAPVAIYETHETIWAEDENGWAVQVDVVSGIEVWQWDPTTETAHKTLYVSVEDIEALIAESDGGDVVLAQMGGAVLNYSDDGTLWLVAPNTSGSYFFSWEKDF
ncbi:MAG: hypothetical protein JNL42_14065 [Anaerolineae bacterium]|nr:hypothetical protein [Anaerolineae bacterium]